MFTQCARALRGLSLAVWLGGGVMTFIAARYVFFGGFVDKDTAGNIMGAIFHTAGWLKVGLATVALASQLVLRNDPASGRRARVTGLVMLALAALLVVFGVFYLEPRMVELRGQFGNDPDHLAHATFRSLHGASMGLGTLELLCVAIALVCTVI